MLRNKKNQRIFQHARDHKAEHERIQEEEQERLNANDNTPPRKDDNEEVWSAKTQEIRNRLSNKKRRANERWNRFSGTSGGGSRGR